MDLININKLLKLGIIFANSRCFMSKNILLSTETTISNYETHD
jgi:hypothetical protein